MRITLGLLSRNRPECIVLALEAAFAGTQVPDEVIVSDDSSDEKRAEIAEIVARFPSVRFLHGPRKGLGANENHIVAHATGDWIVFNGDDARFSEDFVANLRGWLERNANRKAIPTGFEIRNGEKCVPSNLDFFGYQEVPYPSYEAGTPMETIVVQATAWPMAELKALKWLEVTPYGYDEVDMAAKFRKLGYTIEYFPELWLWHDQSDVDRAGYSRPVHVARLYFMLRNYSVYRPNLSKFLLFAVFGPLQLAFGLARRGRFAESLSIPSVFAEASRSYSSAKSKDWRQT